MINIGTRCEDEMLKRFKNVYNELLAITQIFKHIVLEKKAPMMMINFDEETQLRTARRAWRTLRTQISLNKINYKKNVVILVTNTIITRDLYVHNINKAEDLMAKITEYGYIQYNKKETYALLFLLLLLNIIIFFSILFNPLWAQYHVIDPTSALSCTFFISGVIITLYKVSKTRN